MAWRAKRVGMSSERMLIQRAQQGDTRAFEVLVTQHSHYVYNVALRLLNDPQEAEDMAQEVFVRAWRSLPTFRGQAQFRTWLYRIVTNVCYNRLPKLKRQMAAADADERLELADRQPSVEAQVGSAEMSQQLAWAIGTLPEKYRLLITLRHVQGMSYGDIADTLDMPLGSVKTGIFRARKLLRDRLEPYWMGAPS